jgi:dihydrofolate reductase
MRLTLLAALSENRVIGREGALPWRLPDELAHVKRTTMGHTLVMGRKTYESIGRPLPGRTSIVISRNRDYAPHPDVIVVESLEAALAVARERSESEVFVFGGEAIYALALPRAKRLHLTRVHTELDGDAFFPELDLSGWTLVEEEHHPADERHAFAFTFQVLERVQVPESA